MPVPEPPATPVLLPAARLVATLSDGTKIKERAARMRACDERNEKGKLCTGHLKRFFGAGVEFQEKFGKDIEVYRCEHCHTLYLPNPNETARTGTLAY